MDITHLLRTCKRRRTAGRLLAVPILLLVVSASAWAGQAPPMPKQVQDTMKSMQNMFGGGKSGGDADASLDTIKKLLAKERNIKIWESRGRIFLEGRVTSKHMRARIATLKEVYGNLVDLTEYQPDMDTFLADMELIKEKIEDTLNKNFEDKQAFVGKQEVGVNIINDKIVISGELNTKRDIDKAIHIAKIYNDNVVNNLNVRKQMIEVAAIFAKVKKTDTDKVGTQGLQSAVVTIPVITSTAEDGTPVRYPFDYFRTYKHTASPATFAIGTADASEANMAFYNFFKKNAILARPHLASVNGQASKFLGGGEKAIKTVTANTSDVEYKEYGVILETTPALTTDGRISLKLKLEFSVPEANGEDFVTFRHEGEAILASGQGMVLSGLINEARSRGFTRTPFLGKVPILSFFFGQREESTEHEDLVLITIPRVPGEVRQAPYPKTENTAKAAERAHWIRKPDIPHRILDHIKGKRGAYWREGAEVLMAEPESGEGKSPKKEEKEEKDEEETGAAPATEGEKQAEGRAAAVIRAAREADGPVVSERILKEADADTEKREPQTPPSTRAPARGEDESASGPEVEPALVPPTAEPAPPPTPEQAVKTEELTRVTVPGVPEPDDYVDAEDM